MNTIYICKVTAYQARGNQIDISKKVGLNFFNMPLDDIENSTNYSINICHADNLVDFESIELQPATNLRFSSRLNSLLAENGDSLEENDLLIFEKIGRSFSVRCIKKADDKYDVLLSLFEENERHMLLCGSYENLKKEKEFTETIVHPLQQIYYGAPGTGKSYTINDITKKEKANTIRTTFHPDTDYASFVGAYKPTTKEVELRDLSGHKVVEGGKVLTEERISYEFVNQSFLKAYVNAWKLYAAANQVDEVEREYLVIEEINRGNCAQIFGDLFQLLDRNASGFSDYPIEADADMQKQLRKQFDELELPLKDDINALYGDEGRDIVGEVLEGKILLLPNNLYIWATMNTSDQSLFPIDSAFKRRWDWKYMPISDAGEGWTIELKHSRYDWWEFLEAINSLIGKTTFSEDKKLGYFFCKAKDGVISADMFVGKVIFYLWNDVFKDYGFEDEAFVDAEDEDENKLTFQKFYLVDGHRNATVNESKVEMFLKNLGLEPIEVSDDEEVEEQKKVQQQQAADSLISEEGNPSFSLNGQALSMREIVREIVKGFINDHRGDTSTGIKEGISKRCMDHGLTSDVVITELDYRAKQHQSSISAVYKPTDLLNGEKVYVYTQWRAKEPNDNFYKFIKVVHANGWGIIENIE